MGGKNHSYGGPIIANSTYVNGKRVQTNSKFSLPVLQSITAEIPVMGKLSVPLLGLFEDAEHKTIFDRLDEAVMEAYAPYDTTIEHRYVQVEIDGADGKERDVPYKVFIEGKSKVALPSTENESGTVPEYECIRTVKGIFIYREGKELFAFNRFKRIYRVLGKDYYRDIEQYL